MSFNASTYKSYAARAGHGDLKALETLLRDIGGHLESLDTTELGYLNGVTAGTVTASKAVVVGASKEIDTLTVTTLKSGVTAASTESNISNTGKTTLGSTEAKAYTMAAPAAGVSKTLTVTGGTTEAMVVTLASGTFDGTNHIATFAAAKATLSLEGLSTEAFCITGNVGSVTLSTE